MRKWLWVMYANCIVENMDMNTQRFEWFPQQEFLLLANNENCELHHFSSGETQQDVGVSV